MLYFTQKKNGRKPRHSQINLFRLSLSLLFLGLLVFSGCGLVPTGLLFCELKGNGEGYCGGPGADGDPVGTPNPTIEAVAKYKLIIPNYTCETTEGKTIPSYKDMIVKSLDGKFYKLGDECSYDPVEITDSEIKKRGILLGYQKGIYQKVR